MWPRKFIRTIRPELTFTPQELHRATQVPESTTRITMKSLHTRRAMIGTAHVSALRDDNDDNDGHCVICGNHMATCQAGDGASVCRQCADEYDGGPRQLPDAPPPGGLWDEVGE